MLHFIAFIAGIVFGIAFWGVLVVRRERCRKCGALFPWLPAAYSKEEKR